MVLHEFAHKLDMLDHVVDGTPPLPDAEARQRWIEVCTHELELLRSGHGGHLLDRYGATDPGEFFAVATEVFFSRPIDLERHSPTSTTCCSPSTARTRPRARCHLEINGVTPGVARRWRRASKHTTVPAMATLSHSVGPAMGMVTALLAAATTSGQPVGLVPHHERHRPGEVDLVVRSATVDHGGKRLVAGGLQVAQGLGRSSGKTTRSTNTVLAQDRTTLGLVGVDPAHEHHRTGAGGDRRPHQGADVAGVGDLAQHQHQIGGGRLGQVGSAWRTTATRPCEVTASPTRSRVPAGTTRDR